MPESSSRHHYGKCMVTADREKGTLHVSMECASCGKFELDVPQQHMRSVVDIITKIADQMGVPDETMVSEVVARHAADSRDELKDIEEAFDNMSLKPSDKELAKVIGKKNESSLWE